MVVDFPERVTFAGASPRNDRFIVSGEDTIYHVDRITKQYLAVYNGLRSLRPNAVAERRKPAEIQERISQLSKR